MSQELREQVRRGYAQAALTVQQQQQQAGCCGDGCGCGPHGEYPGVGAGLYSPVEQASLPADAVAASLGCGNPTAVVDLHEGETVLDLGCGGGIDVLLSAHRVGPSGKAYGLDMTEEMLTLARRNAADAGASNVEFLQGHMEDIPLPDASIDVIISNCVLNLSIDKPAVFAQMHRVLRPAGRIGISDIVADDDLSPHERAERGSYVACIAGALSKREYHQQLSAAGFTNITLTVTHQVTDGMHSAIIRATKPALN
ncbi:MAG: arsenite methyltransferase [Nitriliruptorales bacterium]